MVAETRQGVVASNKRRDRSWFIVMSGMVEKSDERVGKGESGVRITLAEASYMLDWRLTWRPVCDPKAVTEMRNAKTEFPTNRTLAINFLLQRSLHRHPSRQLRYTRRKCTIQVYGQRLRECMHYLFDLVLALTDTLPL